MNRLYRIDCCFDDNPTRPMNPGLIDAFSRYFDSH